MSKMVIGGFLLFVLLFFVVWITSFEYITIGDNDNETSSQSSARNAMTKSINWGNARVNEEITINEKVAEEAVLREYANSTSFKEGNRMLNIYQVSGKPPLLAVESYSTIETPFVDMANKYTKKNKTNKTITRSREVIIYEAKGIEKND
ncbi:MULTISPECIES: DUF5411 family protein [Bacillati]|uniref:DUF5411 family protein n=1 Tax=Bacillati TaxID=1783272 RepID=UPI00113FF0DC|nr:MULTISPECIES: DUF5411 family protein [Terrabacteria group]MED3677048.1 DUF5411 family protein [Bacillus velezensis]